MPNESDEYGRPARPPDTSSVTEMREASRHCTACHLYKRATQTVFGEGPKSAVIMLIGEQPGDSEDVTGKPFVGPAGKIMDEALEEAGIDRGEVYVTNAVKHFKWGAPRQTADSSETELARNRRLPPVGGSGIANR
jgi:uracil-DNA glycosylase